MHFSSFGNEFVTVSSWEKPDMIFFFFFPEPFSFYFPRYGTRYEGLPLFGRLDRCMDEIKINLDSN